MADPLEALVARAQGEPFFLASVLAAYARSEGLDDAGLAAALGCPVGELPMLRLCRAPRTDPDEFWEDVTRVAERFGIDPGRLAEAVKAGRVALRFQAPGPAEGGFLIAARDREPEPPEKPPEAP
jgi:hypothetical protein